MGHVRTLLAPQPIPAANERQRRHGRGHARARAPLARLCSKHHAHLFRHGTAACASPPVDKAANCQIGGSAMGGHGPIVGFLAKRQSPRGPVQESENLFVLSVPAAGARRWWSPQVTLFPTPPRRSLTPLRPRAATPGGSSPVRSGWLCICLLRGPRSVWVLPPRLLATYAPIASGRAHASDARCIHDHDHDITLGML